MLASSQLSKAGVSHKIPSPLVIVILLLVCLQSSVVSRLYCPPSNFVPNANRTTVSGYRTAILAEIHGKLWVQIQEDPVKWREYFDGHHLARNLYLHAGILGIDKIYLTVFYNETLYHKPPEIETIYPPKLYCVVDWYKLGVLEWRPQKYGGSKETWPLNWNGQPTMNIDWYKTRRGYNPIYAEIKNFTDWIFVLDMDEQLLPINFDHTSRVDWCSARQPPLVSRILDQMLMTATRNVLKPWSTMMSGNLSEKNREVCSMGLSWSTKDNRCKSITAFTLPVYIWVRGPNAPRDSVPTVRTIFPSRHAGTMKNASSDGYEESWKSVYQTRFNPPLQGLSLHQNYMNPLPFFVLAPRAFHSGMSLELMHQRAENYIPIPVSRRSSYLRSDYRVEELTDAYHYCMQGLL